MLRRIVSLHVGVVLLGAAVGWLGAMAWRPPSPSQPFSLLPDVFWVADAQMPENGAPAAPRPDAAEPSLPSATDSAQAMPEPAPEAPPPCTLPKAQPASTAFLPDPIVPVDAPKPAPEDDELESRLARFPRNSDISAEQVEHAHLAGKILFLRALYLQSRILAQNLQQPDSQVKFPVPATVPEAEAKMREWLEAAVGILTRVRPHPSYKAWSQALYYNAWALVLLSRVDEAVNFLQIVGRTRSQSVYANYSRFSLVFHYLKQNNPVLAAHWLVQITRVEPRHETLWAWARLRTAVAAQRRELFNASLWEKLFSLPAGEPLTAAFWEQAAAWCVLEKVDADCIREHAKRLSPAARKAYMAFAVLHAPRDPGNLNALCKLIEEK